MQRRETGRRNAQCRKLCDQCCTGLRRPKCRLGHRHPRIALPSGRIDGTIVDAEIARLEQLWPDQGASGADDGLEDIIGADRLGQIDPFDRVQLAEAVRICRKSRSLSDAGRTLFATSRPRKRTTNDADRLRKYLLKFGLSWEDVAAI